VRWCQGDEYKALLKAVEVWESAPRCPGCGNLIQVSWKSHRLFPYALRDLTPVARDLVEHFRKQEYEVSSQETITNGFDISITKGGGIFKSVLGLKTALKISIEPASEMTKAQAGVGIFGQQAIPTAITLFVFWPVIITQIWGFITASRGDYFSSFSEPAESSLNTSASDTPQVGQAFMTD
jgi:hypothetical protein